MSTQMPFLICQQYVLRCPLLMGEDSNEMGFCEAKMSFSRTNEAGLTGLKVSSKDLNLEIQWICYGCARDHICSTAAGPGPKRFSASFSFLTSYSPFPAKHSKAVFLARRFKAYRSLLAISRKSSQCRQRQLGHAEKSAHAPMNSGVLFLRCTDTAPATNTRSCFQHSPGNSSVLLTWTQMLG